MVGKGINEMAEIEVFIGHIEGQMIENQAHHHQKKVSRMELAISNPCNHPSQYARHDARRGVMEAEGSPPDPPAFPIHLLLFLSLKRVSKLQSPGPIPRRTRHPPSMLRFFIN